MEDQEKVVIFAENITIILIDLMMSSRIMKLAAMLMCLYIGGMASAQTYETQYRRPVSGVMKMVGQRFGVKFKFDSNVDTAGVMLTYADFRIRPYSLEQTLDNICNQLEPSASSPSPMTV